MNWSNINVRQFQQLSKVDLTQGIEAMAEVVSIVYKLNLDEVEAMPLSEFNRKCEACKFVNEKPKEAPLTRFKNYRFVPDITKVPSGVARYIEIKHYTREYLDNMHKILSCMVQPTKRRIIGHKAMPYDVTKAEEYANDMLELPIECALGWVGFFLRALKKLRKDLQKKAIVKVMVKHWKTKRQAMRLVIHSWHYMDGSINVR